VEIKSFKELIGVWDGNLTVLDSSYREILKLYEDDPKTDGYSNLNGWQKTGLHKMPQFTPLKDLIVNKCFDYLAEHQIDRPRGLECVHLFANINPKGASNIMHHHTFGQISGVYWLKAPLHSGDLIVMSPFTNRYLNTSTVPKTDYNALQLKPKSNQGVFFNSNLTHYVDINRSNKDRVSVAFHILIHA
tara:strand:- start:2143 stop:2709 length:567 start_codon:yes stop_codon:yes gene_type:complete